VPRSKHS